MCLHRCSRENPVDTHAVQQLDREQSQLPAGQQQATTRFSRKLLSTVFNTFNCLS